MKKFARRIEDFVCANCGETVTGNGYTNHCPKCLCSMHVDIHPGDRAADCHGLMRAVAAAPAPNGFTITHKCQKCGKTIRQKSAPNDDTEILIRLTANSDFIFGK